MKWFTPISLIITIAFVACSTTPAPQTVVPIKPLESYVDPSLRGSDRTEFLKVLSVLNPEARDSLSYLTPEGTVYSSSDTARRANAVYKQVDGNLYQSSQTGSSAFFPADTRFDPDTFGSALTTQDWQGVGKCYRVGLSGVLGEKSGPFRRMVRKPVLATDTNRELAGFNWMTATIYLPRGKDVLTGVPGIREAGAAEAGGYFQRLKNDYGKPIFNGPFIYAGGWSANGEIGSIGVDAGFQLSTGGKQADPSSPSSPYVESDGNWQLFLKAEKQSFVGTNVADPTQVSDSSAFRFPGGTKVELTFFNFTDLLVVAAKGVRADNARQPMYRVLMARLKNGSQWRASGLGQVYKLMTTIGQGQNGLAQKLDAVGFIKNSRVIGNPKVGYLNIPVRADNIISDLFSENTTQVGNNAGAILQPNVSQTKPFFDGSKLQDCSFPDATLPANNTISRLTGLENTNMVYPNLVQTAVQNGDRVTSIDLRSPSRLQVGINTSATIIAPWIPGLTRASDPVLPVAMASQLVTMQGVAGSRVTPTRINFRNYGHLNSTLELRVYPIGQDLSGFIRTGNRVRWTLNILRQLTPDPEIGIAQTKPVNSPWSNELYDPSSTTLSKYQNAVLLKRPGSTNARAGLLDEDTLIINAQCPANPQTQIYRAEIPIVYTTNLSDDNDTKADPTDDQEAKYYTTLSLGLKCQAVAVINTAPTPITLTGTVGSSTNTIPLTISNTGDQDSTLEYKQYFVTTNTLDSSLLNNPTGTAGARLTLQAITVPPRAEFGLVAASGFTPSGNSSGSLLVTNRNNPPVDSIPVSYYCSSAGTFTGYVNLVYSTGATNDVGLLILESQVVAVNVTCQERPSTSSRGYGGSSGEPWLRTFDGNFLGFQAVGEFILAQNSTSGLNVQVRYVKGSDVAISEPSRREEVSFNAAVAMQVGSDRVAVYAIKGKTPCCTPDFSNQAQVRVNGQIIAPPSGLEHNYAQSLPGGGRLSWFNSVVSIISPNGNEVVEVTLFDNHVGTIGLSVPASARGQIRGLLGNFDDTASNDFQSRGGSSFTLPLSTNQLYLEWGESWRLNSSESLFDYESNQTTNSFTDRSFPPRLILLESLSPQARALGQTACMAAQITDPRAMNACILDVGLTGNTGWANIAKGLDPGSSRLLLAPLKATVVSGERITLNADLIGNLTTRDLIWTSNAGQIQSISGSSGGSGSNSSSSSGRSIEFVAPMQPGLYTVQVRSAADSSLTGSVVVQVNQAVTPVINRLAVGDRFNALLNSNGTVSTWGLEVTNSFNTVNCSNRATPLVAGATNIQSIAAGSNYVVAVQQNGNLMAWGSLYNAQASSSQFYTPLVLSGATDWVGITVFGDSLVSLKRDGTAWVWLSVSLGYYRSILKPFLIQDISNIVNINHGLLLKRDGTVWNTQVTGHNGAYVVKATQVIGLENITQISSSDNRFGSGHHLALKADGSVWAWGRNDSGQLGLGTTSVLEAVPQAVSGLGNVKQIQTSVYNSFVVTNNGELLVWGRNFYFSNNPVQSLTRATLVEGAFDVQTVQSYGSHLTLVRTDGVLMGIGSNDYQQVACLSDRFIPAPTLIAGVTW